MTDWLSDGEFGAIVPVGPSAIDVWRAAELVKSLVYWQPNVAAIVFLEDAPVLRGVEALVPCPSGCRTTSFARILGGRGSWRRGRSWLGTLTAGILRAMGWIHDHAAIDFILRIDSDALVIGPFARFIANRLALQPSVGVLGALGMSANPAVRALQDLGEESRLCKAARLWPLARPVGDSRANHSASVEWFGEVTSDQLVAFDQLRIPLAAAMRRGYWGNVYCQGGACAISRSQVERMREAGYLEMSELWVGLPFPDDVVLGMYARAVGLTVSDCSKPGEPFGVQHRGLPYPPTELVRRGHSLVHSVRNDRAYGELAIREFFTAARQGN